MGPNPQDVVCVPAFLCEYPHLLFPSAGRGRGKLSTSSAGIPQLLEGSAPVQSSAGRPRSDLLLGPVRSHQRQVKPAGLQEPLLNADPHWRRLMFIFSPPDALGYRDGSFLFSVLTLSSGVDPSLSLRFPLS